MQESWSNNFSIPVKHIFHRTLEANKFLTLKFLVKKHFHSCTMYMCILTFPLANHLVEYNTNVKLKGTLKEVLAADFTPIFPTYSLHFVKLLRAEGRRLTWHSK